jgi:competence protein ComEA
MQLTTRDRVALGAIALAITALLAAAWIAFAPAIGAAGDIAATPDAGVVMDPSELDPLASASAASGELVVDVQGAVAQPGVVTLSAGARVADAIAAAGGYAADADLAAAAAALNLAAPLSDGEKVYVPVAGVAQQPGSSPGAGGGGGGGGLVNMNTATPQELDALPGIGPVTVQKIVAGRAERAFTSLDELVERKILDRGQVDDIRELATV